MRQLSLLLVAGGIAVWLVQAPAMAADFEVHRAYGADQLSCRELAREEGRFIIEISLLHPLVKLHKFTSLFKGADPDILLSHLTRRDLFRVIFNDYHFSPRC